MISVTKKARGLVGERVLAEERWRDGQKLDNALHEIGNVEVFLGRHWKYLGLGQYGLPASGKLFELRLLFHKVNLVDDK